MAAYNSSEESKNEEINAERRQARVNRENLLRNYGGRRDNIKIDLEKKDAEYAELENKVRNGKKTITDEESEITQIEKKLNGLKKNLKRDQFELRQDQNKMFKINKEVNFLKGELAFAEKKLKKIEIEGRDN